MRLAELLQRDDVPEVEIAGVAEDSRKVRAGDVFFARGGTAADGARFAQAAIEAGAVAVVAKQPLDLSVPVVVVANAAKILGEAAQRLVGEPTRSLDVYAVTGTNGKTTTAYLLRHLLGGHGRCGMVGTVEIDDGRDVVPAEMTTPPAVELADLLRRMVVNGCHACAIEASSHALEQHRLAGVCVHAAGFTNLTGDHLDYHGTMDAYAAAKAKLFAGLPDDAIAAVNVDNDWHDKIAIGGRRVTFSPSGRDADWRASDVQVSAEGTRFTLHGPDGQAPVAMRLIGRHNVENALCAAAMVGGDVADLAAKMSTCPSVPGRLERVGNGRPTVLVDYAHTDDALDNVLRALRPITADRLRVVFGCGGDRDRTKRPRMAAVAERHADDLYVTSDNPRTEDPQAIVADVVAGLSGKAHVEVDRRAAIRRAIADAAADDVVLIAGKGHEDYQIVGTVKEPFDDRVEARAALRLRGSA